MDRYPLKPGAPVARHVSGGLRIPDLLGRAGLPDGPAAGTRECSGVGGKAARGAPR